MEILREAKAKGGSRDDGGDGVRSHLGQASPLAFNAALVASAKVCDPKQHATSLPPSQ